MPCFLFRKVHLWGWIKWPLELSSLKFYDKSNDKSSSGTWICFFEEDNRHFVSLYLGLRRHDAEPDHLIVENLVYFCIHFSPGQGI